MRETVFKITHIASGDLWAGAEAQLLTLCKSLNSMNELHIDVILLNNGELENRLKLHNINVLVINELNYNSYEIVKKIKKQLLTSQSQLVHTHRIKENILGSLAAKICGIPSVRTVHGSSEKLTSWMDYKSQVLSFLNWISGQFIQSKIIAVSQELEKNLRSSYQNIKLTTIENGVDIDPLLDIAKNRKEQFQNNQINIAIVGRLVQVKRVDLFIKIAKYCTTHYPKLDIKYYIFGDGPLMQELKDYSKSINIIDKIHFEGHVTNIHKRISEMDILLITSDHEGLPMTLLESMILGTNVIAHAVGGIKKVLKNGELGTLIYDQTEKEFADAINKSIVHSYQTQESIEKAKKHIESSYSSNINASQYYSCYCEILE